MCKFFNINKLYQHVYFDDLKACKKLQTFSVIGSCYCSILSGYDVYQSLMMCMGVLNSVPPEI